MVTLTKPLIAALLTVLIASTSSYPTSDSHVRGHQQPPGDSYGEDATDVNGENSNPGDDPIEDLLQQYFNTMPPVEHKHHVTKRTHKNADLDHMKKHHHAKKHEEQEVVAVSPDENEMMQGDQPASSNNFSSADYNRMMRERMKESWMEMLKQSILNKTGRRENPSSSYPKMNDSETLTHINFTRVFKTLQINDSQSNEDHLIAEKIRSYYPSCEMPRNTDEEIWKEESTLNLYFNMDYSTDDTLKVASSILRLYRFSSKNATNNSIVQESGCEYSDDKLIRVSVYWYTKPLRKNNRSKRRLSDSKVIAENAKWVELSIRPAIKAWSKGRNKNLGLSIEVEDQDANILKPGDYFKGASCMVGTSTPKPIPTVVLDAARRTYELDRANGIVDPNSTSTFNSDLFMLPIVDICFLEFPENFSLKVNLEGLQTNACNLMKIQEQIRKREEREKLEKLVSMGTNIRHHRHLAHQFQQRNGDLNNQPSWDFRSQVQNAKVVIPHHELFNLNVTSINR